MSDTNHGIPNGVGHVKMLDVGALHALRTGEEALKAKEERNLEFIGVCMTALYQAATCHRECYGGQHLLEALCGRAYNLSAAAIHLAKIGYYDEALNLVRGIGEIANLVALGAVDQTAIKEWLEADEKTLTEQIQSCKSSRPSVENVSRANDCDARLVFKALRKIHPYNSQN